MDRRLPGRAAALAYHRVGCVGIDPWDLAVSPDHFAQHLTVMRRAGRIIRLERLLRQPLSDRVMARRVQFAVTLDDGYLDNLTTALPVLEAFDCPATVFIAPGLLDRSSFWWDVLAELVLGSDFDLEHVVSAARSTGLLDGESVATAGELEPRALHDLLHRRLIGRDLLAIDDALEQMAAALSIEVPVPDGRPLTTSEVRSLAAHPLVSVGVHTMTHRQLPGLPPDDVRREIGDAARRLDELLGPERRVLAYPYGSSSPGVARLADDLGFDHAVTTESRWLRRRGDDLSAPRLHPRDVDGDDFEEWLRRWT